MLEIQRGDSVMVIAPRGNWWTEILMQLGVSRLRVVEIDDSRRVELQRRWNELRLDIVADCLLYTSPSPRDGLLSRMPSSA